MLSSISSRLHSDRCREWEINADDVDYTIQIFADLGKYNHDENSVYEAIAKDDVMHFTKKLVRKTLI